jgi:DNA-directed RNA polymerase subunit RPC12/RpoP
LEPTSTDFSPTAIEEIESYFEDEDEDEEHNLNGWNEDEETLEEFLIRTVTVPFLARLENQDENLEAFFGDLLDESQNDSFSVEDEMEFLSTVESIEPPTISLDSSSDSDIKFVSMEAVPSEIPSSEALSSLRSERFIEDYLESLTDHPISGSFEESDEFMNPQPAEENTVDLEMEIDESEEIITAELFIENYLRSLIEPDEPTSSELTSWLSSNDSDIIMTPQPAEENTIDLGMGADEAEPELPEKDPPNRIPSPDPESPQSPQSPKSSEVLVPSENDQLRDTSNPEPETPKNPTFSCVSCSQAFPDISSLTEHANTHQTNDRFTCPHCGKLFESQRGYTHHIQQHISLGVTDDFSCRKCHKKFTSVGYLRQHIEAHHEVSRIFPCGVCGKRFRSQEKLEAHEARHTDKKLKRFSCTVEGCGKSYVHMVDLKRHLDMHNNYKPHVCKECGKAFIRGDQLRNHEITH